MSLPRIIAAVALSLAAALAAALPLHAQSAAEGAPPTGSPSAHPPAAAPPAAAPPAEAPPAAGGETDVGPSGATAVAEQTLTPPSLRVDAQPVYPPLAQSEGLAAEVTLDIDIDAAGRVEHAEVTRPAAAAGYGFDEAALVAAKQLQFEPARLGAQAVPVRISFRFRFVPELPPQEAAVDASAAAEPGVHASPPPPAPTGQLWGRLQERGTRLPLGGVKVTVFRGEGEAAEGYETDTDAEGGFHVDGLGAGDWRVLADPDGYYPVRATETIAGDERTEVRYVIERRSYNRYDVVVETNRVRREVNRTVIDARQAEKVPGTFGDVLAVVQNFPGVARSGFGQVVVRGSAPEDTRIYVEGVDVPSVYHFGGLRGVLPVGMIERIDFYPGNFSVAYGRATGGIIDVQTRKLAPQKLGGYADVSILDTSLYLEVPVSEDFAFALGGRRSYIDVLLESALPADSPLITAPRYYDFQALASYRPDPAHSAEVFFFYSNDKLELLFEEPPDTGPGLVFSNVGYAEKFHRTVAKYHYVPGEHFDNELKLSYGRNYFDFNIGDPLYAHSTVDQAQLRDTARLKLSDALTVRAGIDYLFQKVKWSLRVPDFSRFTDDEDGPPDLNTEDFIFTEYEGSLHSSAAFLELEVNPFESLLIVPGVRIDHFTRTQNLFVAPRLTMRQALGKQWALKGGVGLFVQEPGFQETDEALGNPELSLEKAVHYSAGFEYMPEKHINIGITGFYKRLHDLTAPTDAVVERDGETVPMIYSSEGAGRAYGLELSAKHELADGLFGWVAYTLSRAERREPDERAFELFDFDQTHILTVVASYKLPRNWEIGSRFRLVSGNLYTPVTGAVYDVDSDEYRGITGARNSARVGSFHQLDVRLDKRWIFGSWMLNAYLDIQNVYDRENPEGLGYNYDFSEEQVRAGLPLLPVIGLRGEF